MTPAMTPATTEARHVLDLRNLERDVPGPRSGAWLGMLLFIVIEATVVAAMLTSHLYYRLAAREGWPPPGVEPSALLRPSLALAALLASRTVVWALDGGRGASRARARLSWGAGMALVVAYAVTTAFDLALAPYRGSDHIYGSVVWTTSGYQLLHALVLLLLATWAALAEGRRASGRSSAVAASVTRLYWTFVALAAVPNYLVLYVMPHLS